MFAVSAGLPVGRYTPRRHPRAARHGRRGAISLYARAARAASSQQAARGVLEKVSPPSPLPYAGWRVRRRAVRSAQ